MPTKKQPDQPTPAVDLDDDVPVTIDEATFDFAAWVAGVRPTRRSVKLYARADLLAVLDELGDELAIAKEAARDREATLEEKSAPAALEARIEQVYADLAASGVRLVIEGRDEKWLEQTKTELNEQGITDDVDVWLHQLARQVVTPTGVTYEALAALREKSEPQIRKLLTAWTMVNNQPVQVGADFSRASSATRGGRTSS